MGFLPAVFLKILRRRLNEVDSLVFKTGAAGFQEADLGDRSRLTQRQVRLVLLPCKEVLTPVFIIYLFLALPRRLWDLSSPTRD